MKDLVTWLVVGGDGLIGRRLASDAKRCADSVIVSTRRLGTHFGRVYVDLAAGDIGAVVATAPDVTFLCAAMTNMQACQRDPELSWRINVTETVNLASELLKGGAFVIFLSSNTVFDGKIPWPSEGEPYAASTEYGRQKAAAEQQLLRLPCADRQMAIVRLSKVLSFDMGMTAEFISRLRKGERCRAFSDLLMSPVSLSYVAGALLDIGKRRCAGIHHLSGAEEISYAVFAQRLAAYIGVDPSLVDQVESCEVGVDVPFRPQHPGLGMQQTAVTLGIAPEPFCNVLNDLFSVEKSKV